MLAAMNLKREAGTMYEYGFSMDILARVVEVVSGQRFDHFLKERIFDPLRMVDTGFVVDQAKRDRLAKVYEHVKNGELQPVERFEFEVSDGVKKFAEGGSLLFSTFHHYTRSHPLILNIAHH